MKKYKATWSDVYGIKHNEGVFVVTGEYKEVIMLERLTAGTGAQFPDVNSIVLPKEGYPPAERSLASNPQYWGKAIQVHLGSHPWAFVFEPTHASIYVFEVESIESQKWLEDFLADNAIDYSKDGVPQECICSDDKDAGSTDDATCPVHSN